MYQTPRQYTTVEKAAITDSAMNVILYVVSDSALNEHGVSSPWLRCGRVAEALVAGLRRSRFRILFREATCFVYILNSNGAWTTSKKTWCLTSTETIRVIRDGREGGLYTYRYTVTTNDSCIKVGSDESHFNVSLTVRDKVTRQCPQTTTFEEKGEPKRYRTEVLPLTSLTPYR